LDSLESLELDERLSVESLCDSLLSLLEESCHSSLA